MPVTHEFSRRAAALGTALALVMLPFTGTIAPANAELVPSAEAEASSAGKADSDPDGSVNGTDAASAGDSGGSSESAADGSASGGSDTGADGGEDSADPDKDADADTGDEKDPACDTEEEIPEGEPCIAATVPLEPKWDGTAHTLQVDSSKIPDSWSKETFSGPKNMLRLPVQDSEESTSSTDDSGNPVPSTTVAEVPEKYKFGDQGFIVDASKSSSTPMKFKYFDDDPGWKIQVEDGKVAVVSGDEYKDDEGDDGAIGGANTKQDADSNGTDDDGGSKDTSGSSDMSASNDSKSRADSTAAANGSNSNADSSAGSSSDPEATSNSDSKTSSDTSSDSNSSDSAKADSKDADSSASANESSNDADSAGRSSDSDSSAKADGSDSGSADKDDGKDDKGSADKDGSGSTSGDEGHSGDDTTPDPATGNGSTDTRDEIPGDVGNDWLPGNDESSPPPDYSDPVPQNPDKPVPEDDTDLITGGDQPEPRGNNSPSTSFGESIVSTIVSSWPIFILAAFGMAAVGFIMYLVGRRNKQN